MPSYVTALRNARQQAVIDDVDAGAGAGTLRVYSGTPPASANDALSGNTLLAQLTMSDPCAPAPAGGVLTFSAISPDTSADASGTPTFCRLLDSDSNVSVQLTASGPGGGGEVEFDAATITAGQQVSIAASGTITEGNA